MEPLGFLLHLFNVTGVGHHADEPLSLRDHALQCAALAETAGAPPALIAAALLHEIERLAAKAGLSGPDSGLLWLESRFGAPVTDPIRLNGEAKRYLCAAEPGYEDRLSPEARRGLARQGGPMAPAEAEIFLTLPGARAALLLRRWDDRAKIPGLRTPPLAHFMPLIMPLVHRSPLSRAGRALF